MTQFLRLQRVDSPTADDGALVFTASTPGKKRDGYDTAALPWRVDNYRSNPIITWVHDFVGNRLPIGRAEVEITGGKRANGDDTPEGIRASIIFDPDDEFAQQVERKYRTGFLHAISVSWDDVDKDGVPVRVSGGDAVAHDLLEMAAVPVPGDPDALLERQATALRSLAREIDAALDEEPDTDEDTAEAPTADEDAGDGLGLPDTDNEVTDEDEGLDRDVAAEMVDVFQQGTDDSDAARLRTYRALLPAYRRLGWTAPEFVERSELDALDPETWRALFLHDEPDLIRAGKVLSARNKADLAQAMKLIRGVLDTAGGMEDEDDEDAGERSVESPPSDTTISDDELYARMLETLEQELHNV